MNRVNSKLLLALTMAIAVLLSACSTPASHTDMVPQEMSIGKQHPKSVKVLTSGGSETGAMDSSNIADADLKMAIEDAIVKSKLFKTVVKGTGGDYELAVRIVSLNKPTFGLTFTVELETAWTLTRKSDNAVIMRKAVQSSGTATVNDAFVAITRLRLAVEKSARENISKGLKSIGELNLR
ncbi:MAG: hypothetical protein C4516_00740 [Oxalobacter sp.]|jgi:hypothetical protein|nr:MAG: hypothetical protein C4516_00740 [Oxalobacter sp.]